MGLYLSLFSFRGCGGNSRLLGIFLYSAALDYLDFCLICCIFALRSGGVGTMTSVACWLIRTLLTFGIWSFFMVFCYWI